MEINWIEWLGYLASLIILVSLLMSSIKKLRWINLFGAAAFSIYGFMLGMLPVGLVNFCIVLIDAYFLIKMYRSKEYFKILHIEGKSDYLRYFLKFYDDDINKYNGEYKAEIKDAAVKFFVLRDMVVAGVLVCSKHNEDTLKIELDFATPKYRDFRIGQYIFEHEKEYFIKKGYTKFIAFSNVPAHTKY